LVFMPPLTFARDWLDLVNGKIQGDKFQGGILTHHSFRVDHEDFKKFAMQVTGGNYSKQWDDLVKEFQSEQGGTQ
jgi:hypothetical protein